MASRKLVVEFVGDVTSLERAGKRAQGTFVQTGAASERAGSKLKSFAKIVGTAFAVEKVAEFGRESIKAAKDEETAQTLLRAQLNASKVSWRAHGDEIEKTITKQSTLNGFMRSQLTGAFTEIVRTTGSATKATKDLALAEDLARGKHMDLSRAALIVAKVAGGNTGILKRYGIQIDKGATSTEALAALQTKFAGQAKAYGETTAGAQDRARAAVESLQVSFGQVLLPVLTKVATEIANLVGFFQQHTEAARALGIAVAAVTAGFVTYEVVTKAAAAATALWSAATKVGAAAQWLLNAALDANPISLVVLALAGLVAGIVLAYRHSETFRNVVNKLWADLKVGIGVITNVATTIVTMAKTAFDWVKGHWPLLLGILTGPFGLALVEIVKHWTAIKNAARDGMKAVIDAIHAFVAPLVAAGGWIIDKIADGIKGSLGAIKDAANWLKDAVVNAVKSVFKIASPSKVMAGLGKSIAEGLLHGFGGVDIVGFVKHEVGKLGGVASGLVGGKSQGGVGLGGVYGKDQLSRWLTQALQITGHFSAANLAGLYKQAMSESGGNPRAINLTDINAQMGHPSKGLLQTIDSTFNAYKMPGHGDIWNPVDNAIAAIRYMYARYGHIVSTGHGYAGGTPGAAKGWAWVGEKGRELVKFKGGEQVLSHSDSMQAVGGYARGTRKRGRKKLPYGMSLPPFPTADPNYNPATPDRTYGPGGIPPRAGAGEDTGPTAAEQALIDAQNAAAAAAQALQESIDRQNDLIAQQNANQLKIIALTKQGPEILASVVAAVNGGIGGKVGLGFQSPSYAGGMARYR